MTEYLEINGGVPLEGEVSISGAKNAALPMLIAALLTSETVELENVPNLEDVNLTLSLLEHFGAEFDYHSGRVRVKAVQLRATDASYSLVKALRASFWVLAPVLARGGAARVSLPGGDIIGVRPVDIHLAALTQMGADINVKHGVVFAAAPRGLRPTRVQFRFPSVGATHQVMMAAALTPGTTLIQGAAREPEVAALANLLSIMGAQIEGIGSSNLVVHGKRELGGASVRLIGDRVEAGTYLLACAAAGGAIKARGIDPAFFGRFLDILSEINLEVACGDDFVAVRRTAPLRSADLATGPFPELATDLQAPLMAALSLARGTSRIEENVFEGRFGHVAELCRMGADISVEERTATVKGVAKLTGAPVEGADIRGAAALVVAALSAEGLSTIYEPHHLRRGYEGLERKLTGVGARIGRRVSDAEDYMLVGC